MTDAGGPGPGWYPDPEQPGKTRWWDGTAWEKSSPPTEEQPAAALPGVAGGSDHRRPGGSGSTWGVLLGVALAGVVVIAGAGLLLARTGSSEDEGALESAPTTPGSTTTIGSTTANPTTSSAARLTTVAPTTTRTTTTTTTTSEVDTQGFILEPGDAGGFTSPSGNIACNMSVESGASCWIGEKQWEIDQPADDPFCEIADWGNAIEVDHTGVRWPCYTDMGWPITADPLQYGDRMRVGDYECASAENGVTCLNADGRGFRLARAAVTQF